MVHCAVLGCKNYYTKTQFIRYFSFPKDPIVRAAWVNTCGKKKKFSVGTARICSDHFTPESYKLQDILLNVPPEKQHLKVSAIPTLKLPVESKKDDRAKRKEIRERKKIVEEAIKSFNDSCNNNEQIINKKIDDNENKDTPLLKNKEIGVQTEINIGNYLEKENLELKKKLQIAEKLNLKNLNNLNRLQHNYNKIKEIFTKGQIKKIERSSRIIWSPEDISFAISLYKAGPGAYCMLLQRRHPLPSVSTLNKWTQKLKSNSDKLNPMCKLLQNSTQNEPERLCTLMCDEM